MQKATISEVKNHLSAYLRKVRAGETILILDRDEPVARIEPAVATDDLDAHLARLVREGLVKPPTKPVSTELLKADAPTSRKSVLEALLEERREGR